MDSSMCVVLGSHINAYGILKELDFFGLESSLVYSSISISCFSNIPKFKYRIENNSEDLQAALVTIYKKFGCRLVIYPTDDLQLEMIDELSDEIADFCYIPFNTNVGYALNKSNQYDCCERIGVPYPKSTTINMNNLDISKISFPVIIKPVKRDDLNSDIFRALIVNNVSEYLEKIDLLKQLIAEGSSFIVSELIGHDDKDVFAYSCFRGKNGQIFDEWVGEKLNQFPNRFGVFSSARVVENEVVKAQGRKLVEELDLTGFVEPEFKLDRQSDKYLLTEINLRSMMWHGAGFWGGSYLHYAQYCDANGITYVPSNKSINDENFVLMLHELMNLIRRKGYIKPFISNIFSRKSRWAVFNWRDLKPFLFSLLMLVNYGYKYLKKRT